MDALDALITAGHAGDGVNIEQRVVRDLARMLRGRVLLHYANGQYLRAVPQSRHTLNSWTLHRLICERRIRKYTVRKRPEFWRPDQVRPRALLVFPVGNGVACVARQRRFHAREARAVRTVLRFLEARRGGRAGHPIERRHDTRARPVPSLAGEGLIGTSRPWQRILRQVSKIAPSRCSIVLQGETGTGKERLARAIHSASRRSQGPFVPVNCGALSAEVLSSELFGHVRGAFTGAHRNRDGLIVRAHRGTLFLDEIADMPMAMQASLLRVLEERRVMPVGGARPRPIDARVLCAANRDLEHEVASGRFREDLYHRLNVVTIELPPLRDRLDDIPLLADHLLGKIDPPHDLHPDAIAVLMEHTWPGNVRELDNVLRAAALLEDGPEITPEILRRLLEGRRAPIASSGPSRLGPRAEALLRALGSEWLSGPEIAQRLGISRRTANREVRKLLDQGLVEAHGEARARTYRRSPQAGAIWRH